tara:strand:- start:11 stop:184 length:174 start_codon:yes stop_codon:yes gene_type:complete
MEKYGKVYRQEKASQRKEERKNRTPEEQLRLLDERLGKGIGASKERKRLTQILKEDK